jgi:hypothetical protein
VDFVHQFFAELYRKRTAGTFNHHFKDVTAAELLTESSRHHRGKRAAKPVHEKMHGI